MLGEQDNKTNTLYSMQPNGFVNRTVSVTTGIGAPGIHVSSPLIGSLYQRILMICGDSSPRLRRAIFRPRSPPIWRCSRIRPTRSA
jgi:hypothetical protein